MTPRAWSCGLLFAGILWAALIVAAQTVGVEAWHDSAVPQGAFVEVRNATAEVRNATATVVPEVRRDPPPTARVAPRQRPEVVPTPMLGLRVDRQVATVGTASTYGPGFDGYLALPAGRGIHVRICGAGGCIDRVSNDTGPVPSLHRVADLDVADFEAVSGLPWTRGLCRVSVEVLP